MGPYCHHGRGHVHRHVVTVFAVGRNFRIRPSAASVLANPCSHAALLCGSDTTRENVANAPIVALTGPFWINRAETYLKQKEPKVVCYLSAEFLSAEKDVRPTTD